MVVRMSGRGAMAVVVAGLALIATGCVATQDYAVPGLPHNLEVVGGGLTINWKAPTAGTAYLVEKTSGKIIETESLDEGEVFEFEIDPEEPATFEKAVGVPLPNARIVLLFKPANPKSHKLQP